MDFRPLPIFATVLILALAVSHAALPAEMYWKSVFPNTPMPKAMRNLLLPSAGLDKGIKNMLNDLAKNKDPEQVIRFPTYRIRYSFSIDEKLVEGMAQTNPDVFFFESELHLGKKMKVKHLIQKASKASFLPRQVADSIPFSTQKFPEILKYFSLQAKSTVANLLGKTIEFCEAPAIRGEEKYCTTSLESFIDLGVSKLGKNIHLLSNELEKETGNEEFTISQGVEIIGESEIVCHKMDYAYAVFLCHSIANTTLYTVPLVGADGVRARALAVCHKDTSAWNPKHLAFQILKVKPGTVPICHFLPREILVWVPNTSAK